MRGLSRTSPSMQKPSCIDGACARYRMSLDAQARIYDEDESFLDSLWSLLRKSSSSSLNLVCGA
eukprot:1428232-Prymnesium_polylepis.1